MIQLPKGKRSGIVSGWSTDRFDRRCSRKMSSWVRAVDFSPDGSYFVIATSGGHFTGRLCDTVSRWTTVASGSGLDLTWVARTGSDSLLSVAVTEGVVYVGGHQRWFNNPLARREGPSAVPRPGLAALSPLNGVPLAWNPGRSPRGFGTTALLATRDGLWVGNDTNTIGSPMEITYTREKIALFPWAGGETLARGYSGELPGEVFLVGPSRSGNGTPPAVRSRELTTTRVVRTEDGPFDFPGARPSVRGAFMVDKALFCGRSDQTFWRRPMYPDGLGDPVRVDLYRDPAWTGVKDGWNGLYDGVLPDFYAQLPRVTGMFYSAGRLYCTRSDSPALHWRVFSIDSGIVGPVEQTVHSGTDFTQASGAFLAGGSLYFADRTTTRLRRVDFVGGRPRGDAVTRAWAGRGWAARALVLYAGPAPGVANEPPQARAESDCADLTCTFSAAECIDPDGRISSYDWDLGDGTTATGPSVTHTFAVEGPCTVTLTVTDDEGATADVVEDVLVSP